MHELKIAFPLLGEGVGSVVSFAAAEISEFEADGEASRVEEGGGSILIDGWNAHAGKGVPVPKWEGEGCVIDEFSQYSLIEVEVGAVPCEKMPGTMDLRSRKITRRNSAVNHEFVHNKKN